VGHDDVLHIIRDLGKDNWNGVIDIGYGSWYIKLDKMRNLF